ncbi:MAG: DUF2318 domain-containing protein [Dehalococcoidales bacterium]|nr:DUF2318 domain-containing protein [Dehalococcoidales bacterium]
MLKLFVSVLQSSLMIAFVVAVVLAWLEAFGPRQLLPSVKSGLILALAASAGLTYGVETGLQREPVEGVISLLAVLSAVALALSITWSLNRNTNAYEVSGGDATSLLKRILTVLAVAALVLPLGLNVALSVSKLFAGGTGLVSTELVLRLAVVLLALAVSLMLAVILRRVVPQVRKSWLKVIALVVLLILALQESTTALQIGLVRGIVPPADWLFQPAVVLINNYYSFYYGLFAAVGIMILLVFWEQRRYKDKSEGLNPAQNRKLKASRRRMAAMTTAAAVLLGLAILVDGATAIYASRPLQLSPATVVTAQKGTVSIQVDSLSDGQLHRFSYETADGIVIRFLAVHKGSGVYGVGMDACTFCGAAGYRQDGENVICNRCQAAINAVTIGFPGGCNPIPIDSQKNGDSLVIPVETLESVKGVFAR